MLDRVIAAFSRQDYKTASQLVKQLLQQSPHDPWAKLYVGKLHEVAGKLESAEKVYRQLLQDTLNPSIATQARQGLQRLEAIAKAKRQEAIAQAKAAPENSGVGFLVLEPIDTEAKTAMAQSFARIMKLDPYTARLQLPSRGWRLYRTGSLGELQVYGQELRGAGIPTFWVGLEALKKIHVFRVLYIQSVEPQVAIVCQNEFGQLGSLSFSWTEVTRRVRGLLPIFGEVVDLGIRKKLQRKEQTQDYAQVYDLHLPGRHCIVRFCDGSYQFQQGLVFDARASEPGSLSQSSTRINWNHLQRLLDHSLNTVPLWNEFSNFAETALEHLDLVDRFDAHIDLFRKAETNWDPAFHLYSGLVFTHASL